MKQWTLGFVFTSDFSSVLLIHKEHPQDQKGFWNGLGGKYENNETSLECIRREVKEESDLDIQEWKNVGLVHGTDWEMSLCTAVYTGNREAAHTTTDEEVRWFSLEKLQEKNVKRNLQWMIPLCRDAIYHTEISFFDVLYTDEKEWDI